jgi:hypothetical protein
LLALLACLAQEFSRDTMQLMFRRYCQMELQLRHRFQQLLKRVAM